MRRRLAIGVKEGRLSKRSFLLALITIAFMALAMKLSCNELKKAKPAESPEATSVETTFLLWSFETQRAFAQDASIDELEAAEDASEEVVPTSGAAADVAVEETAQEDAEVGGGLPELGETALEPVDPDTVPAEIASGSVAKTWSKILWIWIICMIIPLALWIWRGWTWICAVYGVYYELKVDPDNTRSSTLLKTLGVFNKKVDSLHISEIKDIRCEQTLFQKYFRGGVGTITLFTKDLTDGKLVMENMPEPNRIFSAFDALRRHFWSRGGFAAIGGVFSDGDGCMEDSAQ